MEQTEDTRADEDMCVDDAETKASGETEETKDESESSMEEMSAVEESIIEESAGEENTAEENAAEESVKEAAVEEESKEKAPAKEKPREDVDQYEEMETESSNILSEEDVQADDIQEIKENGEVGSKGDKAAEEPAAKSEIAHETEMVSDDELSEGKAPLDETEEVSDTELPPNIAEAPLDTEAVSDEELPPLGKRKKKASDKGSASKKGKVEKEDSPQTEEKEEVEKSSSPKPAHPAVKSKTLPELEKYWKAVNDDPTDFTGWTYLLQYIDQENDVEAAREAYDAFLALYPYCYGYWRKYADYERKKGDKTKSEEVYLRGLKAIPLSVDLWIHYLNFCKTQYKDDENHIREEFNRAIEICGLEFRSDRLWDAFIKWETEGKHYQNTFVLYEKLLMTPTQGYKTHFEDFEDFVRSNQPNKILKTDEFLSLRSEVVQKLRTKPKDSPAGPPSAAPPGADDEEDNEQPSPAGYNDEKDRNRNQEKKRRVVQHADEETTLIRERIIASRKKLYKETVTAVLARWNYEEGIKRPYFHVKPLERSQLNTWKEYLDFEISQGDERRTIILFERCLIACALYQEYWLKFIKYLEERPTDMTEKIRDVYQRACYIHHPKKSFLSLSWATFEENLGNIEGARQILQRLEENVPNILLVSVRRINLERRAGNNEEAANLYEKYIANVKNKANYIVLSIKYARFCWMILNDVKRGIQVLRKAIEKDPDNPRLYSQLLELTLMQKPYEEECLKIFNEAIQSDKMDLEYRRIFAQRKIEFLEDFGSTINSLKQAQADYNNILKELREKKKLTSKHDLDKSKQDDLLKNKGKSDSSSNAAATNSYSGNSTYNQTSNYMAGSYEGSGGQYNQASSYQQQPFGQYSQADQGYSATGYQNWGYSQTTGYGNYNQNWGGYNYYS